MNPVSLLKEPLVKALVISLLLHGVLFGVLNRYNYRKTGAAAQEFKSVQIEFLNVAKNLVDSAETSAQELPAVEETPEPVVADPVVETPQIVDTLIADDITQAVFQAEKGTAAAESVLSEPLLLSSSISESTAANPVSPVSKTEDEYSDLVSMTLSDIRIPSPSYPARAKQMGWEGDVEIYFTVNSKGRPDNIEIKQSSGYEILDRAVLDTVKKRWRFSKENTGLKLKKIFSFRLI
jgi:TonB family protein